jgi:ABC-type lipoprotein release transport system permease subunit
VLGLLALAAVAASLVVGILPARRAATTRVADVLRTE